MKFDPPATIVVASHINLSRVNMGTLTVRVHDTQGFLLDMPLPVKNIPGPGRRRFSGGAVALKGEKLAIAKESYMDVDQFKMPRKRHWLPYIRQHLPRSCPQGQLPNGSRVPDEGYLGSSNTDRVGSGLPTFQEWGHGGGYPSHNSCTAFIT